jgi:hypothetical protein
LLVGVKSSARSNIHSVSLAAFFSSSIDASIFDVFRLSYPDIRQFNTAVTNEGSLKPKNFWTALSTYSLIASTTYFWEAGCHEQLQWLKSRITDYSHTQKSKGAEAARVTKYGV